MQTYYTICVLLLVGIQAILCLENDDEVRNKKLISSFQIVKFPNDACDGTGDRNGTCYTTQECSDKGGTTAGSCADGFGVCCTFTITNCGSTSNENNTAWTMPTTLPDTETACSLTVCPSTEICSLRLDFTTFVITGPSVVSTGQVRRRLGTPVGNLIDDYTKSGSSYATNCMLDVFTTTSASVSTNAPAVCGTLTGEHMYIEADGDRCNKLQFNLASVEAAWPGLGVTNTRGVVAFAQRAWDITVTQVACTSEVLPPPGCTKYYFNSAGAFDASITSYNFVSNTAHLGSQHERICIRRERGRCIGCFAVDGANPGNFAISGLSDAAAVHTNGCCGYHTMGNADGLFTVANSFGDGEGFLANTQKGFDCVIIPGAFTSVADANGVPGAAGAAAANLLLQQAFVFNGGVGNVPAPPQICGQGAGLGIGAPSVSTAAFTGVAASNVLAANADIATLGNAIGPGISASICTRNVPFTLEFMSDDLDGLGFNNAADSENANGVTNRGFQIEFAQLACQ